MALCKLCTYLRNGTIYFITSTKLLGFYFIWVEREFWERDDMVFIVSYRY